MTTLLKPVARTLSAIGSARRDVRAAWSVRASVELAAFAAVLALPVFLSAERLASHAYLALAAVALGLVVGPGAMPSLCQGTFVGVGALTAAHLNGRPVAVGVLGGVAAAAVAGVVVALLAARLRSAYVAATTWLVAWGFGLLLAGFPRLSGGAQGLVVRPHLIPTVHFELAVFLVMAAILGRRALAGSTFGLQLAAAGRRPAGAAALGTPGIRLRMQAFAGAAAVAGLAGALAVDLALVADARAYGPLLSFQLLVACLVGGAASPLGPVVGVALVGLLGPSGEVLGRLTGSETARFGTMLSALLLLAVLAAGSDGIATALGRRLPQQRRRVEGALRPPVAPRRGALEARGLVKRYGSTVALAGLDLDLLPGQVVALVGPNGSGKTTALRALAGAVAPDEGVVRLDGRELGGLGPTDRVRRGIARTLQRPAPFTGRSVLETAEVGAAGGAAVVGPGRALLATPRARATRRAVRAAALGALATVGLAEAADRSVEELSGVEQRLLAVAAALATRPSVVLLDEPAAGIGDGELPRLEAVLRDLRSDGCAVLVVEHNLRFVRRVADRVIVLDSGAIAAAGSPDEMASDPAVRAAYIGGRSDSH